jgi:hypothetical protein
MAFPPVLDVAPHWRAHWTEAFHRRVQQPLGFKVFEPAMASPSARALRAPERRVAD